MARPPGATGGRSPPDVDRLDPVGQRREHVLGPAAVGDGHAGWPAHAPYAAAYLTCAASELPEAVRLAAERTLSRYAKAG